jgi:lipoprotein-anchoring transpeptidase ErfK/SrfK
MQQRKKLLIGAFVVLAALTFSACTSNSPAARAAVSDRNSSSPRQSTPAPVGFSSAAPPPVPMLPAPSPVGAPPSISAPLSTPPPTAPAPIIGPPSIMTVPADLRRDVSPIAPVIVRADNATLLQVTLSNPEGKLVKGQLSASRVTWTSAEPLGYGRTYVLVAHARRGPARRVDIRRSFTTLQPTQTIYPSFYAPSDATTFGVGQPVVVTFDRPPADRAAAQRALRVTAVPATEGGWYWWNDRTVHWRPRQYWRPGTRVIVQANIYGIDLGNGEYGQTDTAQSFTIGQSKIATINNGTHQMTVYIDGRKNRTIPVAMGRDQSITVNGLDISFITPSGTYIAQEKYRVKEMKSASYGLPADSSLGYDAQIPLAVRISDGGIFVHSAPWSVADQGVRNVSHGCININPVAAQWFYNTFGYGDVVTVAGTSTRLDPSDGFGDWNISWSDWLAGSALR